MVQMTINGSSIKFRSPRLSIFVGAVASSPDDDVGTDGIARTVLIYFKPLEEQHGKGMIRRLLLLDVLRAA